MAASYAQPLLSAQHLNPMAAAPAPRPAPAAAAAAAAARVPGAPVPMRTSNIAKYTVGQRVSHMGISGVSGLIIAVQADGIDRGSGGGGGGGYGGGGGGGGSGPGVITIKPDPGVGAGAATAASAAAAAMGDGAAPGRAFPPIHGAIAAKLLASAGRAKAVGAAGRAANEAIRMQVNPLAVC